METHLQVRPIDGFSLMMAQTTWTLARMCLFGICSHGSPFMGSKHLIPQFWGMNRRFQTKLAKSKNVHIIKTTASIPTKLCTVIKSTKCPSRVVSTHALQIQDGGGCHIEKKRKIAISRPRLERFWRNLARCCSSTLLSLDRFDRKKCKISKIQHGGCCL